MWIFPILFFDSKANEVKWMMLSEEKGTFSTGEGTGNAGI